MTEAVAALETEGLGKRYGTKWGLRDCSLRLPEGRVAALVGPNGAGKSTLLRIAAGITRPSTGEVRVFGRSLAHEPKDVLPEIGYLDQERPLYRSFRVGQMLAFGAATNPNWDEAAAFGYLDELGIASESKIGKLSVGQQAQVAMAMCLAKRPRLLLLDEPVAALDPVAREGLMRVLLGAVADGDTTVLLSTHAISDLAAVCDYLVIVSAARVQLADDLEYVLASHRLLVASNDSAVVPAGVEVIARRTSERQVELLVRVEEPVTDHAWRVSEPTLEEVVLAYLREQRLPASTGEVR
jgi:ABC-2 type transport system ATP-binding protein